MFYSNIDSRVFTDPDGFEGIYFSGKAMATPPG
jgi:hypothetical protein